MARYHSDIYRQISNDILDRVNLPTGTHEIEGGGVTWVISETIDVVTVLDYDQSRHGCYDKKFKPHVIIKNITDCSQDNCLVKNMAGDTLFTFNANNAVTPAYCVLRLTTCRAWELA